MLHYETIEPRTLELLKRIQSLKEFKDARLVGGTALALQLGHRKSVDLDFFGNTTASLEELTDVISDFASVTPLSQSRLMRFMVVDDVKIDVVNYPYEWIESPVSEDGVTLAGIRDIAAMKLSAITNRGTRKDFIDYYFLLKRFTLEELIGFYLQKYTDAQLFTAMKSLTYFDDAESDPMPVMLVPLKWDEVKHAITSEVDKYIHK